MINDDIVNTFEELEIDPDAGWTVVRNNRHHKSESRNSSRSIENKSSESFGRMSPRNWWGSSFYKIRRSGFDPLHPITSFGIILFHIVDKKVDQNIPSNVKNGEMVFLFARRNHTISYSNFVLGLLPRTTSEMKRYISLMSLDEKKILNTINDFSRLWNNVVKEGGRFGRNKFRASIIFERNCRTYSTELADLNHSLPEAPWGFPKGRKNFDETEIACAEREFVEETCISTNEFKIYPIKYRDDYIGTDGKYYRSIYYVAQCHQIKPFDYKTDSLGRRYIAPETGELIWSQLGDMNNRLTERQKSIIYDIEEKRRNDNFFD